MVADLAIAPDAAAPPAGLHRVASEGLKGAYATAHVRTEIGCRRRAHARESSLQANLNYDGGWWEVAVVKAAARGSGAAQYTVEYELLKTIHVVGAAQLRPSWCWSHGAWSSWDFGRELPRHGNHAWEVRLTSRRPVRPPRGAGPAHHAPRGTGVRPAQPATWRRDVSGGAHAPITYDAADVDDLGSKLEIP